MNSDFARVSKLGFGCMRLPQTDPKDPTAIDIEHVKQMVDAYLAGGGNYFDTAFVYHNGASEKALGEALVARHPRESYTIATKCLAWACPDEKTAKSNLPTSLERLGTDYVDFYLLHNVGGKRTKVFDDWGMWDFAQKAKRFCRGLLPYLYGVIRTLFHFRGIQLSYAMDGGEMVTKDVFVIAVANGGVIGGGIPIAPEAQADDGLLDVVVVNKICSRNLPARLIGLMRGKILSFPETQFIRAKKVFFSADKMRVNIDGEVTDEASVEARLLPKALRIHW